MWCDLRGLLTAAAALAAAAPAFAATSCPTVDDLVSGVRVVYSDGSWSQYRALGDDVFEVTESPDPASPATYILKSRLGLFDLSATSVPVGGGEVLDEVKTEYSVPVEDLPHPATGEAWTGMATFSTPDGASEVLTAVYAFGATDTAEIGGCSFERMNVKATFLGEHGWMWQEFTYFTGLGFGALLASQVEGETRAFEGAMVGLEPVAVP